MPNNLPDPQITLSGSRAITVEGWQLHRPELLQMILREEYGAIPHSPDDLDARVITSNPAAFDGLATIRQIEIITKSPDAVFDLLLVTPNWVASPPCFLGLNFHGNHALLHDKNIRAPLSKRTSGADIEGERGSEFFSWSIETLVKRGYALASLYNGDVVPDNADAAVTRLTHFEKFSQHENDGDAPAALGCWSWSLQRALDYLEQSIIVAPNRIAVVGHSRNGKAALLTTAIDQRVALLIANQSGTGGVGPSRDIGVPLTKRETVEQINTVFPHWFCDNFKKYNQSVETLPFDQHTVISLCAPRPTLLSSAAEDLWANPIGSFQMLKAADPVYRLLTGDGLGVQQMPEVGVLSNTRLGHFARGGGHAMTAEDWSAWLDYADKWL